MTTTPNHTLDALRAELRERLRELPGTSAFADALAERERLLGLTLAPPSPVIEDPKTPDDGAGGAAAESAAPPPLLDAWGNTILDAPGPLGQYRIQSAREWDKGRILRVCGEAATTTHLLLWDYDDGERRMVCGLCWRLTPAPDGETEREPADEQTREQAGEQAEGADQEADDV